MPSDTEGDTLAKVTQLRQRSWLKLLHLRRQWQPVMLAAPSNLSIFAVARKLPRLESNTNFMQLQGELTNTENKISYARQLYNSVTSNLQCQVGNFPNKRNCGMF